MGFDFSDIGDVFEDGAKAAGGAAEDAWNAGKEVVETVVNTMTGFVKDGLTYSYGFASKAVDVTVEAVETVVDHAGLVLGWVSDGVGGMVEDWVEPALVIIASAPAKAAEAAVETMDWGLNTMDTIVFDPIETMTFGLVAPNYENGNMSVEAGVPGVLFGSAQVGEHGVGAKYEDLTFGLGGHLGTDGSFGVESRAGMDIAGLPGAKGHIERGPNGEMSIDGKAQVIIPTPAGLLDASAHGGLTKQADGSWSTVHQADGTLYTPSGMYSAEIDVQVSEDNQGNTDVGAKAGGGVKDYDGSGGSVDVAYRHDEDGDTTTDGVVLHGTGSSEGADVETTLGVTHRDSPGGSLTTVETRATVKADGTDIDAGTKYEHEERADGTTRDSVGLNVKVESGDNEFGGDLAYENTERSDGSETETFGVHVHAKGEDFEGGAGYDNSYDRDAAGRETEATRAGVNVRADEFEGGGTYDHERRENADGSVSEHENLSGNVRYGDVGLSGERDTTTEIAPDGTETSITRTSGDLTGIDIPGLPDGFDGPPSFDDLLNEVPTPGNLFDEIPNPEDGLPQIPMPDTLLDQIPALPDLSTIQDRIPGEIPGLGDITDIPEVQEALDGLPDIADLDLPDIGPLPDIPFADQLPSQADLVGALASSGDLSGVLGDMQQALPEDATDAIQAVAAYVQEDNFDEFTGGVVAAEVNEAAADEVWDDLDQ